MFAISVRVQACRVCVCVCVRVRVCRLLQAPRLFVNFMHNITAMTAYWHNAYLNPQSV